MSEYTPSTGVVRNNYASSRNMADIGVDVEVAWAEFDRWLAVVKADAWDEGALWAAVECGAIDGERQAWLAPGDNPYRGNPHQDGPMRETASGGVEHEGGE